MSFLVSVLVTLTCDGLTFTVELRNTLAIGGCLLIKEVKYLVIVMKFNRDHLTEWVGQKLFVVLWAGSDTRWINFHGREEGSFGDWALSLRGGGKIIGDE